MVFPLIKLGYLAIKQLSKPLVRVLREKAKTSPFFKTYIVIPPAQLYHKIETISKLHILGLGKPSNVEKLNEAMAIELGSDLVGEIIIFLIAAGTLTLEYIRSSRSQAKKDEELAEKFRQISLQLHELGLITEQQNFKMRELERTLAQYHSDSHNFVTKSLNKFLKNIEKPDPPVKNIEELDTGLGDIIFIDDLNNNLSLRPHSIYDILVNSHVLFTKDNKK